MMDFEFLKKHCGEGYDSLFGKISTFGERGILPHSFSELNNFSKITNTEKDALSKRGYIEKKLDNLGDCPELILIRTHNKKDGDYLSDDNQIIYSSFRNPFGLDMNHSN